MNTSIDNNLKNEIDKTISLFKQKKFNEALSLSNRLIKKEENIPFLLNLNGLINLSLEEWSNAVLAFQKDILASCPAKMLTKFFIWFVCQYVGRTIHRSFAILLLKLS